MDHVTRVYCTILQRWRRASSEPPPLVLPHSQQTASPQPQTFLPPAMSKPYIIDKCPGSELTFTNCAIFSTADDFITKSIKYVIIKNPRGIDYKISVIHSDQVGRGRVTFNALHRNWANLPLNQKVDVTPIPEGSLDSIESIIVDIDFFSKKKISNDPMDSECITNEFIQKFTGILFSVGMPFAFEFEMKKTVFSASVKEIKVFDIANQVGGTAGVRGGITGRLLSTTNIKFLASEHSAIVLVGKNKGYTSVISPDWDFTKMGIGGLDNEFSTIFRRAFASRVFPPDIVKQLGVRHVKGILLFGPPGTGKTLIARKIGQMLNATEPKIVNGPQILDKYVGESEANIRKLFADAEEEEKARGSNSRLHIIIFDEIDAICKQRGTVGGGTGVHDTVVNQLLTKIDGVEQLNNILVIGMTNRRDLIDDALTRPGRMEVQMEIGLPDEKGRVDILKIHTKSMRESKLLHDEVNLKEIASKTKNFSGAELEGLVRCAVSTAMNSLIKGSNKAEIDPTEAENVRITHDDFLSSLDDIKPAFGRSDFNFSSFFPNGIIEWGDSVREVLQYGNLLISQIKNSTKTPLLTMLLHGAPGAGKSAFAAYLMANSDLPFVKICSPEQMIGYSEMAKVQYIRKMFEDAYKSPLSCILLDDIERIIDYVAIGPRFSNNVLQCLLVLLKRCPPMGRRLLIFGTTGLKDVLTEMGMLNAFMANQHVSVLTKPDHVMVALQELEIFNTNDLEKIRDRIGDRRFHLPIKKLLMIAEFARQVDEKERLQQLLHRFEDEGCMFLDNI
ncbi:vesicle-fusing ATPase 1-like [Octopus vulgaris]|uniref:Vesicle-fusing ATPase n=1 Tax=Octopus vulgaris TaxID=6645 RepID=A0AA36FFP7_OCTVU|nr:vesicle-fusing ATPase 1-like [Octopus vulgaris]